MEKDSRYRLNDFRRWIAVRTRIVDDGEVGLCERQHNAVQRRNLPERLANLPANVVEIGLAEKVVLAVFVEKPRHVFVHRLRHKALAMPEIDGLPDAVGDFHRLAQFAAVRFDGGTVNRRCCLGIRFVGKKPVQPSVRLVALTADFERIDVAVFHRLVGDPLHVRRLDDDWMHDRPRDFRTLRLAAQDLGQRRGTRPNLPVERLFVKSQLRPVVRLRTKDMTLQLWGDPGKRIERAHLLYRQRRKRLVASRMVDVAIVLRALPEVEVAVFLRALHDIMSGLHRPMRDVSAAPAKHHGVCRKAVFKDFVPSGKAPSLGRKIFLKMAHHPAL